MGLIKSSNAPATLAAFSMKDIETQAKALLIRARQQADQLLAAAQTEAQQLKVAAKAEGLAEGKREGMAQGLEAGKKSGEQAALAEHRAQFQQAIAALSAAANVLESQRAELEAAGVQAVVALAIAIARRVTKRQGLLDPQVLSANLEDAMRLVMDAADLRISIHPSQRQTLDAALPQLQMSLPKLKHAQFLEDETLAPGGCKILTGQGEVNADLQTQLDRIVADLLPTPSAVGAS